MTQTEEFVLAMIILWIGVAMVVCMVLVDRRLDALERSPVETVVVIQRACPQGVTEIQC